MTIGIHTIVHVEGVLEQGDSCDPYRLLMRHLHCLLNGFGWKPLFDPSDDAAVDEKTKQICSEVFNDIACE
jgi:hypothetical protein